MAKSSLAPTSIETHGSPNGITVVSFELDGRTYSTSFVTRTGYLDRVAVRKRTATGSAFWQALGAGATLVRVAALAAAHLANDPTRADADLWRATAERFSR